MASNLHILLTMSFLLVGSVRPFRDITALLEFKKSIKSDPTGYLTDSWTEESIDFDGCPSSWNGVVCNGGKVAAVVLENLGISGDVDIGVFANLTKLMKLSLSNNSITGRLPYTVSNFKALQFLDVSDNLFTSPLPTELGKLTTLRNLSLAGNAFSGAVPESLSGLSSLEFVDFSRNSFTGWLPSAFTKLPNLVHLNCSFNSFTKIPKGFEGVGSLKVIDLRGNLFEGSVNGGFLLRTNATYVDFSGNKLEGKMVGGISESVKYLNLSRNRVSGTLIGGELGMFSSIKVLDLSYNLLAGSLPAFVYAYDMEVLRLSNNLFTGFVPNELLQADSSVLVELDLSSNNLTGQVSSVMSRSLNVLKLSSNRFTGELPLLAGGCTHIDLSDNMFEGELIKISKWGEVQYLDLSSNRLRGDMVDLPQLPRLSYLNLSNNLVTKSIPNLAYLFPKLTVLDLSLNSLDGSLPKPLVSSLLQVLILRNNSLSGEVAVPEGVRRSSLRVVDLSNNKLQGYFPDVLTSIGEISELNLAGNHFNGCLPSSMAEMTSLVGLDLSRNFFTGSLPGNLSGTLESFNVSYNNFSGDVPENLKRFNKSSFLPGNVGLDLEPEKGRENSHKRRINIMIVVLVAVACFIAMILIVLLAMFLHYIRMKRNTGGNGKEQGEREVGSTIVVSAEELVSARKEYSPAKQTEVSWSPGSGDSLPRLDVRSPDKLVGELHFLDETLTISPEDLSKAPAEVLGRSSNGTTYRASLENGMFITVKWLKEGVAKERKEFAKEAKKFSTIRHPNVVALRGYYWGPTQHEKLILSEFISPGSLASFLYDQPGRENSPLNWNQRLKIIVDIARGLNYLHFDRAVPHGNMKATNVLLDGSDLNARIADYCLHRLMKNEGVAEQIRDADILGYCAPELAAAKKPIPSFKSDVYSFGVIMLEILTGRRASDSIPSGEGSLGLTTMVRLRVSEGRGVECFDPLLVPEMDPTVEKAMKEVLEVALICVRSDRPGIKSLYEDLSAI